MQYGDKNYIKKALECRQLALKLFMNVMYGYTGASFSGRMPSSEIADAVVQTAKTILENSIDFIVKLFIFICKIIISVKIKNGMQKSFMVILTVYL